MTCITDLSKNGSSNEAQNVKLVQVNAQVFEYNANTDIIYIFLSKKKIQLNITVDHYQHFFQFTFFCLFYRNSSSYMVNCFLNIEGEKNLTHVILT